MALETRGYSTAVVNSLFLAFQDDRQGSSHLSTNHRVGFGCCADRGSRANAAVEEQHIQRCRRWVQVVDWLLSDHLRSMYCLLELLRAGGGIQSLQLAVAAPFGRQVVPSQQGPESIVYPRSCVARSGLLARSTASYSANVTTAIRRCTHVMDLSKASSVQTKLCGAAAHVL